MNKFKYNPETSPWAWTLASRSDIRDIVEMARTHFQLEIDNIFTPDAEYYAYNLDKAITDQLHYQTKKQLIVARDNTTGALLAYAWIGRGSQTMYAQEEVAEAYFLHIDLDLSARQRIALAAQALTHWITWAKACDIPVLVSTSIRSEQTAFMRLHEQMGFSVRGSMAYLNTRTANV